MSAAKEHGAPVAGRVRVEHAAGEVRIHIEGSRGVGAVVFAILFGVWAVGMGLGFQIVVGRELTRDSTPLGTVVLGTFLLVLPVCIALAMGAIAWHLFGRETITFSSTSLKIDAALLTFHRLRCFDADCVSDLRVLERKGRE